MLGLTIVNDALLNLGAKSLSVEEMLKLFMAADPGELSEMIQLKVAIAAVGEL